MVFPFGLGLFCPASALLVAYRPPGLLAPRALNPDKIAPVIVKLLLGHHTRFVFTIPKNLGKDDAGRVVVKAAA